VHPTLKADVWLAERFMQARQLSSPGSPPLALYLALLASPLSAEETEQLISYLRLPKTLAQTLRDTAGIKAGLKALSAPDLSPSGIYSILHGYGSVALTASLIASDSPAARERIQFYLDKLRYVKPALSGADLKRMGVTQGPRIREALNMLREARLGDWVNN